MFVGKGFEELPTPSVPLHPVHLNITHHLQPVLPEFLLSRFIQERKFANMVHEDIPQYGQVRVHRRHLAKFRLERGTKSLKGRWGVELGNLGFNLLGDEFAFEVCGVG